MMSSYPVTPLPSIGFHSTSILLPQAKVSFFTISGRGGTLELTESKPFYRSSKSVKVTSNSFTETTALTANRTRAVRRMDQMSLGEYDGK